jgi:WD40 repeat protein
MPTGKHVNNAPRIASTPEPQATYLHHFSHTAISEKNNREGRRIFPHRISVWICVVTAGFLSAGCGSTTINSSGSTDVSPTPFTPFLSLTPSASKLPIATESPSATSTPLFDLPYLLGTPIPKPSVPITADQAADVAQLARWGKGKYFKVAWSPDNTLLATSSSVGIYFFDPDTLDEIRFIDASDAGIFIAFSPDGKLLASFGSRDGTIYLWNVSDGSLLRKLRGHTNNVTCVAFSAEGNLLASGSYDSTVRLWQISTGETRLTVNTPLRVYSVTISPDGKYLIAGTAWGSRGLLVDGIHVWRISDGKLLSDLRGRQLTYGYISTMLFSPDGMTVAFVWDYGAIDLYRVSDRKRLHTLRVYGEDVICTAISPNGALLATGSSDMTIRIWQVSTGVLLRTFGGSSERGMVMYSVAFSPDGSQLFSASGNSIRIWQISEGEMLLSKEVTPSSIYSVAFSPDGVYLASGGDGGVELRRISDGILLPIIEENPNYVTDIAFSPDGTLLAGASWQAIKVWQMRDRSLAFTIIGNRAAIRSIAFSPDGTILASDLINGIQLWNASTGAHLRDLTPQFSSVSDLAFSSDGVYLAGASTTGFQIWRVSDGSLLYTLDISARCLAFSPSELLLAGCSTGGTILLWDFSNGALRTLKGKINNSVNSIAFSPDGSLLISGSDDGGLDLWRPSDGVLLRTLKAHSDSVRTVAFSPDGTLIASGSWDCTIQLWGIPP